MSKRFQRGLVVGKFSPLHRGHELIINRAREECDEVFLLSYSKPEMPGCEAIRRDRWLSAIFPDAHHRAVTDERLRRWIKPGDGPLEVPANDADETTHRRFCGFMCRQVFGVTVDAVFTSEDYGGEFAEELTRYFREGHPACRAVKHVLVDRSRQQLPVSGTLLRQDIHAYREWLSPLVYASFVQRVCLLGGESSGKSTLAGALAEALKTQYVAEYGRELWDAKSGRLIFDDLRHIAEVQIQREEEAAGRANRFLFCDTSPLTTLFYSHHLFGKAEPTLEKLADRSYDFTILCAPDFSFVQDGTRQPETFRTFQHGWYLDELARRNIAYRLVGGSPEARVLQVRELLGLHGIGEGHPINVF
jgi:HTH-type transcriptional regulator, transcriptional repressor of NAD biosynthesis genes